MPCAFDEGVGRRDVCCALHPKGWRREAYVNKKKGRTCLIKITQMAREQETKSSARKGSVTLCVCNIVGVCMCEGSRGVCVRFG